MKKQEKNIEWYNNANLITWLIIGIISLIILSSQSFTAAGEVSALKMVQNILNHNITYMIVLVYFISLQTKVGKKYFDYSNILMTVFFTIIFVTSILTVFQSFSLVALLTLVNNFLIFIYFFHTFLRGTRFWKEFKLNRSPFNELGNEWYFNAIMVVEITLYAVSLISMTTVDGTFLATFDCIYIILLARYIYLYGTYLDSIKKNINSNGNFDNYREKIVEVAEDVALKTSKMIDEIKTDEKVSEIKEKIEEVTDDTIKKFDEVKEESKEKINKIKEEFDNKSSDVKEYSRKKENQEKYEARKNVEQNKEEKKENEKKGDK